MTRFSSRIATELGSGATLIRERARVRPEGQPEQLQQEDAAVRMSRAGLFGRAAAVLAALGGAAVGAAQLEASTDSQRSPARDRQIFALGLLIERLQAAFYAEALKAGHLTGEAHQFATTVGSQEQAHVAYLTAAAGSRAGKSPTFHFGDATTSQSKFLATAIKIESTGLAAYNGQAVNLTPSGLAAAARLVSVEARHLAWARAIAGKLPAPVAVDVPLTAGQATKVLQQFVA